MWGCIVHYRMPNPKRIKLGPRALKSIFVGYAENSKAYRLLDLNSNIIVESRDVEFLETNFLGNSHHTPYLNIDIDSATTQNTTLIPSSSLNNNKRKIDDTPSEPRRSKRMRKEKNFGSDFISSQAIVFLVEEVEMKF